ncbi:hypothetical protein [Stieleria varia]|nr:hypothetical protein [Stieleria varia]
MFLSRISVTAFVLLATCSTSHAGLCDWLFGRPVAYSAGYPAPYVAGYPAPVVGGAYSAGYAGTPVVSYYGGVPVAGLSTQTANLANPVYAGRPIISSQPLANGVVQAQRPAYPTTVTTYDNPSVYTGLPVSKGLPVSTSPLQQTSYSLPVTGTAVPLNSVPLSGTVSGTQYSAGYTPSGTNTYGAALPLTGTPIYNAPAYSSPAYSSLRPTVPIASTLRGASTSSNPFYGTGNLYPTTSTPYQANYGSVAPVQYAAPVVNSGAVLPIVPSQSGLSRFFSSLFGGRNQPNYYSSYYSAPVTYYRPATTFNPVTGTTVTTQQACSSYVQQLQRTPYNSFQLAPVSPGVTTINPGCNTTSTTVMPLSSYPASGVGVDPYSSPVTVPGTAIGQVGGVMSQGDPGVIPIPSTTQPYYGPGAVTGPLTGPSAADPQDAQNVPKPELQSNKPVLSDPMTGNSETQPRTDAGYYRSFSEPAWPIDPQAGGSGNEETQSREPESPISLRRSVGSFSVSRPDASPSLAAPELLDRETSAERQGYSDIRPIGAPEDFQSPFTSGADESDVPLLPPPSLPAQEPASGSTTVRLSVPVRPAVTQPARTLTAQPLAVQPPAVQPSIVQSAAQASEIQRVNHEQPAWQTRGDYDSRRQTVARPADEERRSTGGWKPARRRFESYPGN